MRLIEPSIAGAVETTPLQKCELDSYSVVYGDLKACSKTPLDEFDDLSELIAEKENYLRNQKKAAARRRLKRLIDELNRRRRKVQKEVDFCNALFLEERAKGEATCRAANPAPEGTGGGGTGGNEGCETGFLLCGDHCCDLSNAYCQGCNSKPICCRLEADCCPSG